jgi:EAL domain-containing protein (putative c-di-GMP-specific phosphodiesterase class I)
VNVSPNALVCPTLLGRLRRSPIALNRVVLELTEHASVSDYAALTRAHTALSELGVRLAVDDAGAGYASLRHVIDLAPDIIKIDRSIVRGVESDVARRAVIAAIVTFAAESCSLVVGEGVESAAELAVLEELGVGRAQGFFLGMPTSDPSTFATWVRTERRTAGSPAGSPAPDRG